MDQPKCYKCSSVRRESALNYYYAHRTEILAKAKEKYRAKNPKQPRPIQNDVLAALQG